MWTRRQRAGITRWEVALGLALVLGALAFATPRVDRLIKRTRRAELTLVLDDLREHLVAQHARTGVWQTLAPSPQPLGALGTHTVPWAGFGGWTPPVDIVRGSYRVERSGAQIRLVGEIDVDGDGVRAVYDATPSQAPTRRTPEAVY